MTVASTMGQRGAMERRIKLGIELRNSKHALSPKELERRTGMDLGSINDALRDMMIMNLVDRERLYEHQEGEYRYFLTDFARGV